ncbi:MAG: 3-deoxy-manno-octulosonate cytidylyltransferase [Pseudomonadota bacterium]
MTILVIIPARMASTRLPGKPLAHIEGRAMVLRVVDIARRAELGEIAVAAGDEEIKRAVEEDGVRCAMTDPDLPSGTDRVRAAAAILDPDGDADIIVNLQADAPLLSPDELRRAAELLKRDARFDVATLAAPVPAHQIAEDADAVKAVIALDDGEKTGRALYFSRAAVPHGAETLFYHVGVYAYRRAALDRFCALPPSPLERMEQLEQLRGLENGFAYGVAVIDHAPPSVDTPDDLEKARALFRDRAKR